MSKQNALEGLTVEGLQIEELMLDGKIDLSRVKNSTKRDKVKAALEALKKQGLPIPSFSKIKADNAGSKQGQGKGAGKTNDEDDDGDEAADRFALRDYIKKMSDLYSTLNSATSAHKRSQSSNVREVRLDSKIGNIALQYYGIAKDFMTVVATSKSKFYPPEAKQEAKEFLTEMEIALGKRGVGSPVAAMRYAFTTMLLQLLRQPFPDIDVTMISDYAELVRLQQEFSFFKPYMAKTETSSQSWGKFNDTKDTRGVPDVNVTYYLPFLEITPYFKDLLRNAGVSSNVIAALDNYILPVDEGVDEDQEFNKNTFIKVNLGSQVKDKSTGPEEDSLFKNWAGNTQLSKFQLDLLGFISKFKLRSEAVIAVDSEYDQENLDNRLENFGRNKMNPDLAVKLWMHLALNAVYKVILEDSFGTMERVQASMMDNISRGIGASLPDMAMQLLNTNKIFFTKPVSDVKEWLKGGPFRFHTGVYKYLKDNWAPSIKSFRTGVKRYIGDKQIDEEQYSFYAIPKLVLPCNPFDSQVERYEKKMNDSHLGTSDVERSILFKEEFLPYAYLDSRTKHDLRGLTVYFDNMLSYSLYVIKRNRRYNAHSYKAKPSDEDVGKTMDDILTQSGDVDLADTKFRGPFTFARDGVGGVNRRRSFGGELYASCQDRAQRLGLDRGYAFQYVHPIDGKLVQGEDEDEDSVSNLPAHLFYHYTNSVAVRFLFTAYWYAITPTYLARHADANLSMTRFLSNVVESSLENCSVSNAAGDANLINKQPDKDALILVRDAFRYSYVFSGSKARVMLDNVKLTGNPSIVLGMTGDINAASNTRQLAIHRTNVNKGRINGKTVSELFTDFDGHINFLYGAGLEESDAKQRFGDCLGYNSIGGTSVYDIVCADTTSFKIHNDRLRLHLGGTHALPFKYGTKTGYIRFSRANCGATFTTRVSACSYQAYTGDTNGLSCDNTGLIENTFGGCLYSGKNNPMKVWRDAIKQWDYDNQELLLYASSVDEFNDIVDFIFSKFSRVREQGDRVGVAGDMHLLRYSCAIPVVVGEHITDDTTYESRVNLIVDPIKQSITGVGHVIGDMCDWNPKQTAAFAEKLGQKAIDAIGPACYNMVDQYYHGVTTLINDSMIYANLRKMLYTSPLPELHDRKSLNQGNILN